MEKDLINNIIKGDEKSFKILYDKHIFKALRTATAITKNKEIAKDATQEAFIRVYLYISNFDIEKPFEPWFYRILINECNRLMKKNSKFPLAYNSLLEIDIKDNSETEDYSHLYEAVNSLKDIHRIPIILKYLQGFSEKEIAEIMDLNINTVKSRLFQGRKKLRTLLEIVDKGGKYNE